MMCFDVSAFDFRILMMMMMRMMNHFNVFLRTQHGTTSSCFGGLHEPHNMTSQVRGCELWQVSGSGNVLTLGED